MIVTLRTAGGYPLTLDTARVGAVYGTFEGTRIVVDGSDFRLNIPYREVMQKIGWGHALPFEDEQPE
jgi:hypothetical protein